MAGMSGGSMLRARRKDVNIKPNRRLDRKSSRGMIYENEELRLRTININAEVERGQTDIKKLKRENEQLRREVGALRGEYDRLERLLHQRQDKESPERQDDEKASFSCCSDCESDCCDVQNDANAAWDCPIPISGASPPHGQGGPCCGGMGGEPLSSVPEEPNSPRGPPDFLQVLPTCRCQPTPSELKSSDCGFTTSDPPREFFTAVVTVPLASHLPTTPPLISMAPAMVFPKTGLDILINNNTFENFERFTLPPPIGFIVPPPPLHEPSDEEPFQIVPNVELTHTPEVTSSHLPELMFHIPGKTSQQQGFMPLCQELTTHFNESPVVFSDNVVMCGGLHQSEDIPNNENFDCSSGTLSYSNTVIPFGQDSICGFQNGGNIEDLLGDLDSVSSGGDFVKDSIFVCKTRKVIQQLTTVQNSVGAGCGCNCRCNANQTELALAPDVVIIDSNSDGSQFFRTEKNIELNYDYPKTVTNTGVFEPNVELSGESLGSQDVFGRNVDHTQTTHTTTEVNSTVMMFRKKNPLKSKSKFPLFGRSHSAPVETVSDEPIYATVKKLPKKLKRLNIRNLENEIRYIPPEDPKPEEKKDEEVKVEAVVEESVVPEVNVKEDVVDLAPKTNGVAHKSSMKADSLSESSEKGNLNLSTNTIPKSPLVRKKKRFSIHFKRKSSKTSSKTSIKEETAEQTELEAPVVKNNMLQIDIKSSESDKLIEASSSPDSPDTVKFKQHPPVFCKKHGKPKHCRENYPQHSNHVHLSHCGNPKPRRREEGYPHHGCLLHKSGSDRSTELAMKKGFHPSKSYFKHDSYQEMTTSHSERERTNSLSSSGHSGFSLGSKPRSMSTSRREDNIPWCGCWGNSCL